VQSLGNFVSSAIAGVIWARASAEAAFVYLAAWMLLSLIALGASARWPHRD
jgi:hypothetical protein